MAKPVMFPPGRLSRATMPLLPSVSYSTWEALVAPKNVPQQIIGKLNAAAVEALVDQGLRSRLADLGLEVYPRERQTPEALNALRKAAAEKWWPIIKQLGIKPGVSP